MDEMNHKRSHETGPSIKMVSLHLFALKYPTDFLHNIIQTFTIFITHNTHLHNTASSKNANTTLSISTIKSFFKYLYQTVYITLLQTL